MKKILLLLFIILFTGCFEKNEMKISELTNKIESIDNKELDIEQIYSNLKRNLLYENIVDIKTELEEYINIENLKEYSFKKVDDKNLNIIIIIRLDENKKNEVKKQMDDYFENKYKDEKIENQNIIKERIEYEYLDYVIFIASNNKSEILNTILSTKKKIFDNTIRLNDKEIKEKFDIDVKKLDKYVFKISSDLEKINDYIIIKGKYLDDYEEKIDKYYEDLIEMYDEEQKNIIKNRVITHMDNNLIVIVSDDNNKVLKEIKID